jgi:hypothetical protein
MKTATDHLQQYREVAEALVQWADSRGFPKYLTVEHPDWMLHLSPIIGIARCSLEIEKRDNAERKSLEN